MVKEVVVLVLGGGCVLVGVGLVRGGGRGEYASGSRV